VAGDYLEGAVADSAPAPLGPGFSKPKDGVGLELKPVSLPFVM
jgi:hypothetical protein